VSIGILNALSLDPTPIVQTYAVQVGDTGLDFRLAVIAILMPFSTDFVLEYQAPICD
jgi:hypothetical protein